MGETKIVYHIDDQTTPYLIRLTIPPDQVTLADFKNALNRPNTPPGSWKFFFKSMDADFGVVKEEIMDDTAHLPCYNGRVVSWLVSPDASDSQSQSTEARLQRELSPQNRQAPVPAERIAGIGDSRPPSFHTKGSVDDSCDTCTDADSLRPPNARAGKRFGPPTSRERYRQMAAHGRYKAELKQRLMPHDMTCDTSSSRYTSDMTSDLESTSFFDSEDDSTRFSTTTETTARSSRLGRPRRKHRRHRRPHVSQVSASSFSSITDSTMSLNIITVRLSMDTVNFLGISIVGQSNKGGDGGIYVGSIMKGGAVALDGRIEPGDMILEVNGVSFESMSNDDAVRTLREAVQKPGPITLVVAKCWDPSPRGYFTIPRHEPVRPIDPSAWVAHTAAVRGDYPGRPGVPLDSSFSTVTSKTSSVSSSLPDSERTELTLNLTVHSDMQSVVAAMAHHESGLEIRDRTWLKITIPNAFIGSDLVDWLFKHVEGFADRRDARKYACSLLKHNFIRHTVNKMSFSEQCYYVIGDIAGNLSALSLEDVDSVSEIDRDTLAPLPPPQWGYPIRRGHAPPVHGFTGPNGQGFAPFSYSNDVASLASFGPTQGSASSGHSGSGSSGSGARRRATEEAQLSSDVTDTDVDSISSVRRAKLPAQAPSAPASVPAHHAPPAGVHNPLLYSTGPPRQQTLPPPPTSTGAPPTYAQLSPAHAAFHQGPGFREEQHSSAV